MHLRQVLLASIFLIFGSSCLRVGPDYQAPDVSVQEEWSYGGSSEGQEDLCWWRGFSDPLLDYLIECAVAENLDLEIAAVRIQEAKAELAIAQGFFYPQQQFFSGSYVTNRLSKNAPPISTFPEEFTSLAAATNQVYAFDLEAMWELDIWGRFRKGIDAATAQLCASIFDQHDVLVTLLANVAEAYFSLREAQELLELSKANIVVQERSLEIASSRYSHGFVTELDIHQASTLLSETRAEAAEIEKAIVRTQNALAVLLAMPPACLPEELRSNGVVPEAPERLAIGIPCDLLRRRPDLRALEMRAYAQSEQIGIVKTDLLPHFSLFGAIGLQTEDTTKWFQGRSIATHLGHGFQWDIFHYGRLRNAVRVEDARLQALLLEYQQGVLRAQAQVENSIAEFLQSHRQREVLTEGVASAERAVDLVQIQYREGLVDFTAVLLTQEAQLKLQRRHVVSRADIDRGLVRIYRGMGGGWQAWEGEHLSEESKEQMCCRTNWGGLLDFTCASETPSLGAD